MTNYHLHLDIRKIRHPHVYHLHLRDEFKEEEHPRAGSGQFTSKPLSESEKQIAHGKLNKLKVSHEEHNQNIRTDPFLGFKEEKNAEGKIVRHIMSGKKSFGKVENIPLSEIYSSQRFVPKEGLRAYIENLRANPELPELGRLPEGTTHVISGHTRLGAQMLAGRTHAPAHVYHFEYDPHKFNQLRQINRNRHKTQRDEFKEEEHPRAHEGAHGGEFVSKGSGGGSSTSAPTKAGHVPYEKGHPELPEHIKSLRIPPAWTNVTYNPNPDLHLLVTGKDIKGRVQAIYSQKHAESQSAQKFARIKELEKDIRDIQRKNDESRLNPKTRDLGDTLSLIMETGIRPGSDSDTQAAKKAYGATTLEGRHVVETPDGVVLKFVGKKGVDLSIPVTNIKIANMLIRRAKKSGPDGRIFGNANDSRLLSYVQKLSGGKFKTKDFRTFLGTKTALDEMKNYQPPKTPNEYKKKVREVAKSVSIKLGNTPIIALQSYINPVVFARWRSSAGV